ncbi:hypothetical protein [Paenibacillus sp. PDC88]|uniref:hypothetical protein n=1 Tax=Paenibacillus sp. PDC88 TaxID=1884375 RepID=UPI000898CE05|nr:hypothetical protein [Paenibacillus sp. PDC88]SDW21906.1 hypothetical protein SAMN05518848_101691 [Paenibacillus sp. PDC88]
MSGGKTSNLGLHTWSQVDRVKFNEFNENFDLIDSAIPLENINAMLSYSKPRSGSVMHTNGFYTPGDGGAASYKIVSDAGRVSNGATIFDIKDGLKAVLIHNGRVLAEQIGMRSDFHFDNAPILAIAQTDVDIKIIEFQEGKYEMKEGFINKDSIKLVGASKISFGYGGRFRTYLSPYETGQRFTLKMGGRQDFSEPPNAVTDEIYNSSLIDIGFDDTGKPTSVAQLCLEYVYGATFDIGFYNAQSRGIYAKNIWEIDISRLYIRDSYTKNSMIYIDTVMQDNMSNTSRILIQDLDVEGVSGTILETSNGALASNIIIVSMSYEHNFTHAYSNIGTHIKTKSEFDGLTKIPLFSLGYIDGLTIGQMNLHGMSKHKFTDGVTTFTDSLFRFNGFYNISVSLVNVNDSGAFFQVSDGPGAAHSILRISSVTSSFKNRLFQDGTVPSPKLQMIAATALGSVEIDSNSYTLYETPYLIPGKLYSGSDLVKNCQGVKTSFTAAYDPDSITGGYVFKRTANDFMTLFRFKYKEDLQVNLRIKSSDTVLQVRILDIVGGVLKNLNIPLSGDGGVYQTVSVSVPKSGADALSIVVPYTAVTMIDYISAEAYKPMVQSNTVTTGSADTFTTITFPKPFGANIPNIVATPMGKSAIITFAELSSNSFQIKSSEPNTVITWVAVEKI